MKILSIANKLPYPPNDGGAIGFLNPLLGLAGAGNEVWLLTFNTSKHYYPLNQVPDEIKSKITIIDYYINTAISPYKAFINLFFSKWPYNIERFINPGFSEKLSEIIQQQHFDIIQVEGLYMAPYIPVIRKYSKALLVYRSHNIEHEIWNRLVSNEKNLLKKIYLKILAKRIGRFETSIINTYDALVPVTDRDADIFKSMGNTQPCHVTLPGWELSAGRIFENPAYLNSVFHLGALDWFPNQEGILWFIKEVWPKVLAIKPDAVFRVAGRHAPEWLIRQMKQKKVEYIGEVENSARFMLDNNIMVVPLLSGSGIRIKCIEGMSLGRPVVTTRIGIEGIPAINGVHLLIADSPDEFARCIINLLDNPALGIQIGKNAFNFAAQNFDLKVLSARLTDFYQRLINMNERTLQ